MKTLFAIATFALVSTSMSTPVQAWELVERCTYSKFFGRTCRTTYYEDEARNPAQELEEAVECVRPVEAAFALTIASISSDSLIIAPSTIKPA